MRESKEIEEKLTAYFANDGGSLLVSLPPCRILSSIKGRRPDNIQNAILNMLMVSMANPFEYWVTISLKEEYMVNAYREWRESHSRKLKYVEVAVQTKGRAPNERTSDKRWHIHALMSGIPMRELEPLPRIIPKDPKKMHSEPKQKYRWRTAEAYLCAKDATMVHRIGDPNWVGGVIEQPGKAIYMVRQFENAQPDMFKKNRRLFNLSKGLKTSLSILKKTTVPSELCINTFQNKDVFKYACVGVSYLHCAYAPTITRDVVSLLNPPTPDIEPDRIPPDIELGRIPPDFPF